MKLFTKVQLTIFVILFSPSICASEREGSKYGPELARCCADAINRGDVQDLMFGLAMKVDPNTRDEPTGRTLLRQAANSGHNSAVRILLAAKADPNESQELLSNNDKAMLMERARQLTEERMDPELKKKRPLSCVKAAIDGNVDHLMLMLGIRVDPNCQAEPDGVTPLWGAACKNQGSVVEILLAAKADPNKTDFSGQTPLGVASVQGHADMVKKLLDSGADFSIADNGGMTPLLEAAKAGHSEVVRKLVEGGALLSPVQLASGMSFTPLLMASCYGRVDVVQELLALHADPAVACGDVTPLSMARHQGHAAVVELLEQEIARRESESSWLSALCLLQ